VKAYLPSSLLLHVICCIYHERFSYTVIDVQNKYQTFTINENIFSNPKEFFGWLRSIGIKCCTNITPIISNQDQSYQTYREAYPFFSFSYSFFSFFSFFSSPSPSSKIGLLMVCRYDNKYFIMDNRLMDDVGDTVHYQDFGGGNVSILSYLPPLLPFPLHFPYYFNSCS
jgi:hypothetical protein